MFQVLKTQERKSFRNEHLFISSLKTLSHSKCNYSCTSDERDSDMHHSDLLRYVMSIDTTWTTEDVSGTITESSHSVISWFEKRFQNVTRWHLSTGEEEMQEGSHITLRNVPHSCHIDIAVGTSWWVNDFKVFPPSNASELLRCCERQFFRFALPLIYSQSPVLFKHFMIVFNRAHTTQLQKTHKKYIKMYSAMLTENCDQIKIFMG